MSYKFLLLSIIAIYTTIPNLSHSARADKPYKERGGGRGAKNTQQRDAEKEKGTDRDNHRNENVAAPVPVPAVEGPTIIDIALSSDDFSILVTALTQENLVNALSGTGPFTVFAPTNAAFEALLASLAITVDDLLAIPSLDQILLYHAVSGSLSTTHLLNSHTINTLNGQSIHIDSGGYSSIILTDQQGAASNIILKDLQASNGIVHAVDAVLLPLFDTIADIAASFDAFSILVAAVSHTALLDTVRGPGPFTVFAPTNTAFIALMDALSITVEDLLAIPSLQDIVLYHVIGNFLLTADLLQLDGRYIETFISDGQSVKVNVGSSSQIKIIDQQDGVAHIGLSDVQAQNGVVHVIDSVLLPLFQTVVDIATSFDDFSILVAAVIKADLVEVLMSNGPFTVFAPNNAAFEILLGALDITVEDLLNIPSLRDILLYHVIGQFLLTGDFFNGYSYRRNYGRSRIVSAELETLKSDSQEIILYEQDVINVVDQQESLTGIASIILANVQAKNGVAHVIDRVLLPLFDTVVQIATSFEKFSILVAAVVQEELVEVLSGDGPFTVFAPPNSAFVQLMAEIHINLNDLLAIPTLKDILLYHVSGSFLLKDDLTESAQRQQLIETLKSDAQTLQVHIGTDGLWLKDAQSDASNIGLTDVKARNGAAHVIDRILVPLFDSVYQIANSFKDYSILIKLVNRAGLAGTLINGAGPFTVFAPNNAAMERLMNELLIKLQDLLDLPSLKKVLLYHIVGDHVLSKDLNTQNYETINGQLVSVNTEDADKDDSGFVVTDTFLVDRQHFVSNIIFGNVEAQNGVAHVIDRVMIPMFDNIMQIANSFKDYSILVKLVKAAGLTNMLTSNDRKFTVFAPNNKAFNQLFYELDITIEDVLRLPNLRDVLFYHIIDEYLLTRDLMSKQLRTMHQGQSIEVNMDEHIHHNNRFAAEGIHLIDANHDKSNVIIKNVQSRNGVVHVVNRVLILRFEHVIQVAANLQDYAILYKCLTIANLLGYFTRPGPFTVYAPNNAAFHKLARDLYITIEQIYDLPPLREILLYHASPGYMFTVDLKSEWYATEVGQKRQIIIDGYKPQQGFEVRGIRHIDQQNDVADIIIGNVETKNGLVHVVDSVLVWRFDSIFQIGASIADYSLLIELTIRVGVDRMLTSDGPFTLFAPNNVAIDRLMYELDVNFEDLLDMPNLRDILWYHILPVRLLSCELGTDVVALNGQIIRISYKNNNMCHGFVIQDMFLIDQQDDSAHILFGNVEANNGPVHVVERVLVLRFDSVYQIATLFQDYWVVLDLLHIAGLDEVLVALLTGPGPFTIWAPRNEAFAKLLAELHLELDDIRNMPSLEKALLYHFMEGYYLASDLTPGTYVMMNGQTSSINLNGYVDTGSGDGYGFAVRGLNIMDIQSRDAFTILGNVEAYNGVVHVIDRVLILMFDHVHEISIQFEDYSILDELVDAANLTEILSNPGPFTVLAPNNEAFYQLMDELQITLEDLLITPILAETLWYHMIDAYTFTDELSNGALTTINGKTLDVNVDNYDGYRGGFDIHGPFFIDGQHDVSNMFIGNVQAVNGIVHVIDRVLIPLFDSIVDVALAFEQYYGILIQLVVAANLTDALLAPGPFTAFAPTNNAFYQLMEELHITIDDLLKLPTLAEVLSYHVVGDYLLSADLVSGEYETANGDTFTITNNNDGSDYGFYVTGIDVVDQQDMNVHIMLGNVEAANGVVHVIDRVMLPKFDTVINIATAVADYSILAELVIKAELFDTLLGPGPFTVFAPNNAAFYQLMDELLIDIDDILNLTILAEVLLYHVNNDYLFTTDLSTNIPLENAGMNGQAIDVNTDNYDGSRDGFGVDGIWLVDGQHDVSNMFIGNIQAKNGIVHVIDRVLLPLFDSIIQIATSFEDYSILVAAVMKAELVDTLLGPGPFTVFAPNNYAFFKLMTALNIEIEDLLNIPNLGDILLYHVVAGYLLSSDLSSGDLQTANGQNLVINMDNYVHQPHGFKLFGITVTDQQFGSAHALLGNVEAVNGVVHVIDEVMLPIFESVAKIATMFDDFSILVAAVIKAELLDVLSGPGPFTVFAPNNNAFYTLMNKLNITADQLLNIPNLKDILLYHVVADYLYTSDLKIKSNLTTINGQPISVNVENSISEEIILIDGQQTSSNIILPDVRAQNGVVHVIDSVLLPVFDSIFSIAKSIDNFSILVAALDASGLSDTLDSDGLIATVFAPTNAAFYNLMNKLNITVIDLLNHPNLQQILLYHVWGGNRIFTYQDLVSEFRVFNGVDLEVTLNGETIQVNVDDDDNVIIVDKTGSAANIIIPDIFAKNGVVHLIDNVLIYF